MKEKNEKQTDINLNYSMERSEQNNISIYLDEEKIPIVSN